MTMPARNASRPRGFTLLEVLVACGILIVGLVSIAAILPAAASRVGEATAMDRAATLNALAMGDLQLRGLATQTLFATPASPAGVVVGEGLSTAILASTTASRGYPGITSLFSGTLRITGGTLERVVASSTIPILTSPVTARLTSSLDTLRGFFLEDDLRYQPAAASSTPSNIFAIGTSIGTGYRDFNRAICWGGILTPEPWGTSSQSAVAVRASIAVFRKSSTAVAISLRQEAGAVFSSGSMSLPGTLQRTRLKPCSAVLALPAALPPPGTPPGGIDGPQWLGIRSSWTSGTGAQALDALTSGTSRLFVVFDRTPPANMLISGSLTMLTFENLLSTDQKILPIR